MGEKNLYVDTLQLFPPETSRSPCDKMEKRPQRRTRPKLVEYPKYLTLTIRYRLM